MPVNGTSDDVPITNINYDLDNPRIKKFLEVWGDQITDERIVLALGAGLTGEEGDSDTPTFSSLRESIRSTGRIIHPIIVNKVGDELTAIEGNTRLAIYREFDERGIGGDWERIPAIVYQDLSDEEKDSIRLQSHLVGPRKWDAYSKAKYLAHLYNSEHLTVDRIIEYCGGKRSEVMTYIAAYEDMEKYYRDVIPDDGSFDVTRFSGFIELQRPKVKDAIVSTGFALTDFATWIHERKISNLQLVRQLPKILRDDSARSVFLSKGAKEALKVLDNPNVDQVLQGVSFSDLCAAVTRSIRSLQFEDFLRLKNAPDGDETMSVTELAGEIALLTDQLDQGSD